MVISRFNGTTPTPQVQPQVQPNGGVTPPPAPQVDTTSRVDTPIREPKGILTRLWEMVVWIISALCDLLFPCLAKGGTPKPPSNDPRGDERRMNQGMIPGILEKWFSTYPRLGKHLYSEDLIDDLNALPNEVFEAVVYAYHDGEPPAEALTVERFVNEVVMRSEEPKKIKDDLVLESLQRLSVQDYVRVKDAYFFGKINPGPLSVERFVKDYVMNEKFGNRLNDMDLIQDLEALPVATRRQIFVGFFAGKQDAPNINELDTMTFVHEHITMKEGALARLHALLRLQVMA